VAYNRKTRRAVEDALNGDLETVDSAVRRALFAISTEQDDHAEKMAIDHQEIREEVKTMFDRFEKMVSKLQATLSALAASAIIAVSTALLNWVLR
jgi:hypothetical protein